MKSDTLEDRLDAAAKAKQALLDRAKAANRNNDPEFAARQEARLAAARAREEREAERRRARIEARERAVAEKKARKEAQIAAEAERVRREEEERLAAEKRAQDDVVAQQRAALMARFGTRKGGKSKKG
ncbi:MAG: hypothetical protein ISP49_17835 [Reyranella sp.]|nr:hypothetical protein [Reyranella sp.]MBL6653460.1 hypothetical protein [Reyranella sp.]